MPSEAAVTEPEAVVASPEPAGIDEFLSEASSSEPNGATPVSEPALQGDAGAPSPASPAAPPAEEFEIDGRKVSREALFQTYRQFPHLQGVHQQIKPYLDLMRELHISPEQVPQFRDWITRQLQPATVAPSAPAAPPPIEQQEWFAEIAETFPRFAAVLKTEISAREAAQRELEDLKQSLTGYTTALHERRQQEAAYGVLSKASDVLTQLMQTYEPLQQEDHRRAFLTWLWNDQQAGGKIADPDYVEGMYLRFNRDALAQLAAAKVAHDQQAHAATVTRGFAESGAPRGAVIPASQAQQDVEDFLRD